MSSPCAYCNHSVNVIYFSLSQSNHIMRLSLHKGSQKNLTVEANFIDDFFTLRISDQIITDVILFVFFVIVIVVCIRYLKCPNDKCVDVCSA